MRIVIKVDLNRECSHILLMDDEDLSFEECIKKARDFWDRKDPETVLDCLASALLLDPDRDEIYELLEEIFDDHHLDALYDASERVFHYYASLLGDLDGIWNLVNKEKLSKHLQERSHSSYIDIIMRYPKKSMEEQIEDIVNKMEDKARREQKEQEESKFPNLQS